ncbi:flavoprotein [Clostridium estertheticum]|uniref:flavoprotein n=1 Tax=Clostridium estertheticum TaxID=238834 RepID=UPI001C6E5130|nr:flavoprotein [Clostridium estertheticum]MBW9153997.1 flavoprotein [Clostridium estertheticum]WLC83136.1 flavoprotein [Clostridium estertheticum]
MDIEELIKAITIQVLSMVNKKVLIFISGGVVNIEDEFDVLKGFNNLKYSVILSDTAKEVIPKQFIEGLNAMLIEDKKLMAKIINESDFILIPVMTRNILAKTAFGIRDTFITTGISDAIMKNKKIIVVKDSFDPDNPVNVSLGYSQNISYNEMIKNHIKTIEGFGVTFINANELKKAIDELIRIEDKVSAQIATHKKVIRKEEHITKEMDEIILEGVITKTDLLPLGGCRNIKIAKKAVITSLAKDYIDSENIEIVYLD